MSQHQSFFYNFTTQISFRGRTYQCFANIQAPEPEVGILAPWVDEFALNGYNGPMDELEADAISEQIEEALQASTRQ